MLFETETRPQAPKFTKNCHSELPYVAKEPKKTDEFKEDTASHKGFFKF